MKKVLLAVAIIIGLTGQVNAQTEKGTFALGGRVNFSSEKDKNSGGESKYSSFNLNPQVNYFVKNGLAIGLGLGYYSSKAHEDDIYTEFSIAPSVRKYFNISNQFKVTAELSVPFYFGKDSDLDGNNKVTTKNYDESGIGVYLSPGLAYFPSKNIAIELQIDGLYYESEKKEYTDGSESKGSEIGLRGNLFNPSIGVRFHF